MIIRNNLVRVLLQIGISIIVYTILSEIISSETISVMIGLIVGAICHAEYNSYEVKYDYNNGICRTCGKPFDIEKRWYPHPAGNTMGTDIDTAVCNTCYTVTEIPGIRYR